MVNREAGRRPGGAADGVAWVCAAQRRRSAAAVLERSSSRASLSSGDGRSTAAMPGQREPAPLQMRPQTTVAMASAHAVGRLNSSAGYADQRGKRACRLRRRGARPIARTVQMSASSPLASDCRAGAPRRLAPPVPRRALVRALGRATWPVGPRRGHSVSLARSHQTAAHWGARPLPTDLLSCRGARRLSAWLHCLRGL